MSLLYLYLFLISFISQEFLLDGTDPANPANPGKKISCFSYKEILIISGLKYQTQKSQSATSNISYQFQPRSNYMICYKHFYSNSKEYSICMSTADSFESVLRETPSTNCVVAHDPQGSPTCLADAILGQRENCEQTTLQ